MDLEMQDAAESSPAPTPAPVPDPTSALSSGLACSTPFTRNSVSAPRLPSPNRGELSTTIISANTALLVQEHQQQILAIQAQLRTQQVKLDHYNKYGVMPEDGSTKKRALLACRRCRRLRTKCFQVIKGVAPCQKCIESGLDKEACEMPERGQEDVDRKYRRNKDDKAKRDQRRRDSIPPLLGTVNLDGVWELLPALDDIVTAVTAFTTRYFQLGFIPKQVFQDRLQNDQRSISAFLQLSILSIAARFTPTLVAEHGGPVQAAKVFMGHATSVALSEIYREPSLERCQAFYLLSIAQQGSAMKHQSSISLATAMRMATLLQLHREETYLLANPTHELVFQAESARRTLWMLHCQDNLHSGQRSPALLAASDITALLPSSEDDFDSAREPTSRAAFEDTPPALENPGLIAAPGRSLFAASIQAYYYWGVISRRAMRLETCKRPWDPESQFAQTVRRLACWENGLSEDFRWSTATFEGHKKAGVDLGYLGVTMIPRLCNIVIRKTYIPEMLSRDNSGPEMSEFWSSMARDLFRNVEELFEQVEAQYSSLDTDEETGAQMAVFCVYTCGFLACYPHKYPTLCPESAVTHNAEYIVERVLYILDKCKNVWPLATRWRDHLAGFFEGKDVRDTGPEGSMGDNKEETPSAFETAQTVSKEPSESSLCDPSDTQMVGYSSGLSSPPRTPSLPPPRLIPDLRILPAPVPHSYPITRSGPEHYANAPHSPVRPHYYVSPQDQHLASFPQQSTPQLYQQSPTSSYHQNPLSHQHHAAPYSQYPQDHEHHPQYPDSLMYHLESLQDRHTASAQQQLTPQGQSRPCIVSWNEGVVSRAAQHKWGQERGQGEQQQREQQQQPQQPYASPYQVGYNSSHEQQLPTFSSISPSQLSFSSHPIRNPWKYLSHRGLSLMTFSEYTWSDSPEDQRLSPLQPQPPPRYQDLGLVLEPFDPVRHADATFTPGVVVKPSPGHAAQQAVAVPPAPAPAPVLEQQSSCPLLILAMNDRYVNELIYFMTKGIPFAPPSLGGLRYLSAAA